MTWQEEPHLRLCVDAKKIEILPYHVHKAIEIPFMVRAHGTVMWELGQHVQLLKSDLIYLVDDVDGWDVHAAALNDIDKIIHVTVVPQVYVSIVYSVLGAHCLHSCKKQDGFSAILSLLDSCQSVKLFDLAWLKQIWE